MNKRAVIYARVSTDEQTKGYSLNTQVEACEKFAKDRGYSIVEIFKDDCSGATLDRPRLSDLLKLVSTDNIEAMIVYDIDRLARKSVYQMLIEEEMGRHGAIIEYVTGDYGNTDEGRLQKQIKASIAEYEKAKILERSKRGKRGKAQSGFVVVAARPPYGYRVHSEPHKSWLVVDEEEAKIVVLVFEWYLFGETPGQALSIRAIAKKLTGMGIPTSGDKKKHVAKKIGYGVWQPGMIVHILKNEAYTGIWHYGKTKMIDDGQVRPHKPKKGTGKQVTRDREEWISVNIPAIIEQESWQLVQRKLDENRKIYNGRPNKYQYLMSRRLKCSSCGYGTKGQNTKGHIYYYCNGKRQIVPLCDMPSFRADILDDMVWEWVMSLIADPKTAIEGLQNIQAQARMENQIFYDRLDIIDEQITGNEEQLNRLLDLYLSGEFSKELLFERKERLEDTLRGLRKERLDLNAYVSQLMISDEQLENLEAFCSRVKERFDLATFINKRKVIEMLDVRGKLAIENGHKVVHVRCLLGQQRLLQMQTSPLSSTGNRQQAYIVTAKLWIGRVQDFPLRILELSNEVVF